MNKLDSQENKLIAKRTFDLVLSSISLLLFSPVFLFIMTLLSLERILTRDWGPLFIFEPRPSRGKLFKLVKWNIYKEKNRKEYVLESPQFQKYHTYAFLQARPETITLVGQVLKRFYLDESSQLIHIFLGDMSFVGPRPLPEGYEGNNTAARQVLKAGLVGFTTNAAKNKGDTLLPFSTDEEYLIQFQNGSVRNLLKTDLLSLIDGMRAVKKGKGL